MERDKSVTVTRESRVSHATTTTPHHTMYFWASGLFKETHPRIRSNGSRDDFGFGSEA